MPHSVSLISLIAAGLGVAMVFGYIAARLKVRTSDCVLVSPPTTINRIPKPSRARAGQRRVPSIRGPRRKPWPKRLSSAFKASSMRCSSCCSRSLNMA